MLTTRVIAHKTQHRTEPELAPAPVRRPIGGGKVVHVTFFRNSRLEVFPELVGQLQTPGGGPPGATGLGGGGGANAAAPVLARKTEDVDGTATAGSVQGAEQQNHNFADSTRGEPAASKRKGGHPVSRGKAGPFGDLKGNRGGGGRSPATRTSWWALLGFQVGISPLVKRKTERAVSLRMDSPATASGDLSPMA